MAPVPRSKRAAHLRRKNKSRPPLPSPASSSPSHPQNSSAPRSLKRPPQHDLDRDVEEPDTQLVFEDPFGDEFEQELPAPIPTDATEPAIVDPMIANDAVVFRPGKDKIPAGEHLVYDESAYHLFHKCMVEWPSLSFDFVCLNANGQYHNIAPVKQDTYPLSISAVLGTQADFANKNKLVCLRMSNLHRTDPATHAKRKNVSKPVTSDDDSSEEEDSDNDESLLASPDRNPILQNADIRLDSTVNRVRVMPQKSNIVAVWTESKRVSLIDAAPALDSINRDNRNRMSAINAPSPSSVRPFYSFTGHKQEGFALDWSRVGEGRLLSGAYNGSIYLTQPASREGASWVTSPDRFRAHMRPVEDIQWSPNERDVFVSCSADKSIRVWDAREHRRPVLGIQRAHDADVNVISWNTNETHLLLSGGDDGVIKVWDMRALTKGNNEDAKPAAEFRQHQKAITCVQWHPTDSSMLCAGSEDGSVSIWDLAVERDAEEELREGVVLSGADEFPPQLLFIHMGQKDVKEARWHPGCTSLVMSTAADGLNVFQASNIAQA